MLRTIFTEEPNKNDRGYRGGLYQFTRKEYEGIYYCNGDEAKVLKLQNRILDLVDGLPNKEKLTSVIEEYGEAIVDRVRGDMYENEAGESL